MNASSVSDTNAPDTDITFTSLWSKCATTEKPLPQSMVKLAGGRGLPLYLVHWGSGNIRFMRELASLFGNGHPVYGFESLGVRGYAMPLLTVTDIAARYVHEIRQVQQHGPYLLGGVCTGAQVAYEMGRQLTEAGQTVGPVIMVNGARGDLERPLLELEDLYELRLAELRRFYGIDPLTSDLPGLLNGLKDLVWIYEEATLDDVYWQQVVWAANFYAHQRYQLRAYYGPVQLCLSRETLSSLAEPWCETAKNCDVCLYDEPSTREIMRSSRFFAMVRTLFHATENHYSLRYKSDLGLTAGMITTDTDASGVSDESAGLPGSRACDGTDAVSDVRPRGRVDSTAGTFGGVEGCRVAGAAPRGCGAASPEP
jgi:Thioesterase domain